MDLANHASLKSDADKNLDKACFITSDALSIHIQATAIDVAINIESSHCYADLERFIQQVSIIFKRITVFVFAI